VENDDIDDKLVSIVNDGDDEDNDEDDESNNTEMEKNNVTGTEKASSNGIFGCFVRALRQCLLKRRSKTKNDKYEYEINEYVEDTGYYNEYDVIFHDTIFYFIWNLLIVLLLLYTSFVYPLAFGFGIWNDTVLISLINVIIDVIFIVDVRLELRTQII